jgi:hypothetical protein
MDMGPPCVVGWVNRLIELRATLGALLGAVPASRNSSGGAQRLGLVDASESH